jgi:pSer/pThr/pTyr-binding forkhead associated (FHA) protein
LLSWLAGTIGGAGAWLAITLFAAFAGAIVDGLHPGGNLGLLLTAVAEMGRDTEAGQAVAPALWSSIGLFGALAGACIGASLGWAYGAGSAARRKRAVLVGAVGGALGGMLGFLFGQTLYGPLAGQAHRLEEGGSVSGAVAFLLNMAARTLGWGAAGLGLGAAQGFINGSAQRTRAGAWGGLAGGLLGGFLFELLAQAGSLVPAFGWLLQGPVLRLVGLTVVGSAIGLLVGLTERALRQAWVRVVAGRNEGVEFLLEKAVNAVGRDELSDVPLFGDPAVLPKHATISRVGGAWVLDALSGGVSLNGQPVQKAPLSEGDIIRIVSRDIEFHQKGAPRRVASPSSATTAKAAPVIEGMCPYCGQMRDANGLCACAPVGPPAPSPVAPAAAAPPQPAAPATWRLVAVAGPYIGQVFTLAKGEVTLGRDAARDVPLLNDGMVSRRHARILVRQGVAEIVDDGSSNGTYVNGKRVSRQPVRPGDELTLGASRFRLEAS